MSSSGSIETPSSLSHVQHQSTRGTTTSSFTGIDMTSRSSAILFLHVHPSLVNIAHLPGQHRVILPYLYPCVNGIQSHVHFLHLVPHPAPSTEHTQPGVDVGGFVEHTGH